jgi:hypothetical protein
MFRRWNGTGDGIGDKSTTETSYEVKPCQMRISEKMPKARDSMKVKAHSRSIWTDKVVRRADLITLRNLVYDESRGLMRSNCFDELDSS